MSRPTYTAGQINQVYERINLPAKWRLSLPEAQGVSRGPEALSFLSALQRYALASIPFESLELHYSRTKVIEIDPQAVFQKIVDQGTGRGGYCMENNSFFAAVLRTLGFQIMSTGGRVHSSAAPSGDVGERGVFFGFGHMVNIVTIDGTSYMVDIGFGAGGPTKPLPLEDGKELVTVAPNQRGRLRYGSLDQHEDHDAKVWIYERLVDETRGWTPCYCFPKAVEFLPADFEVMNYYTSTNRKVLFTYVVLAVKMILSDDGEEVVGETILLGNNVERRIRGTKEDLGKLRGEEQRVEALEKEFGIRLSEMQRSGISGMVSAIG